MARPQHLKHPSGLVSCCEAIDCCKMTIQGRIWAGIALKLTLFFVFAGTTVWAQPAPGIQDFCTVASNKSAICSPLSSCETVDNYWSVPDYCRIPGPVVGKFPAHVDLSDVCGNVVTKQPLLDTKGNTRGTLYVYKLPPDIMMVVAALHSSAGDQLYFEARNGTNQSASLQLWDEPIMTGSALSTQYTESMLALPEGKYTCLTWVIDTVNVCNPTTSTGLSMSTCSCLEGQESCPTRDLSDTRQLFLSLKLNTTRYVDMSDQGCGRVAGYELVGSHWNAAWMGSVANAPCSFDAPLPNFIPGTYPPLTQQPGPSYPPVPPPAWTEPVSISLHTRQGVLVQATHCTGLIRLLSLTYLKRAERFSCEVMNSTDDQGMVLNFTLSGSDGLLLKDMCNAIESASLWKQVFASLPSGCDMSGSFSAPDLGQQYDVCSYPDQEKRCKYAFIEFACHVDVLPETTSQPPTPAPMRPPMAPPSPPPGCSSFIMVNRTSSANAFSRDDCDALSTAITLLYAQFVNFARGGQPSCKEYGSNSMVVGLILSSSGDVDNLMLEAHKADKAMSITALQSLQLTCGDSLTIWAECSNGDTVAWNSTNLASLECKAPNPQGTRRLSKL